MRKSVQHEIDTAPKTLDIDVSPELAIIRRAIENLRIKVQSIEKDSYYRRSMVSAIDLLTAAADMLESSSRLGFMNTSRAEERSPK